MTIIELKDLMQDNFDADYSMRHDTNTIRVTFWDDYSNDFQVLDLVITGKEQNRDKIGCHVLLEDASDDWRIVNMVETALRDSFPAIYIHLDYKAA